MKGEKVLDEAVAPSSSSCVLVVETFEVQRGGYELLAVVVLPLLELVVEVYSWDQLVHLLAMMVGVLRKLTMKKDTLGFHYYHLC